MVVAHVASTSSGVSDSQSQARSTNVPGGAVAGMCAVLMLEMWMDNTVNPTVTWPPGFAEIVNYRSTTDQFEILKCALKILTGSDSGTYDMTWVGTKWNQAQCAMFSGVDGTTPLDVAVHLAQNSSGTGLPANSLVTANSGSGLLLVIANENSSTQTPPTGYTEPTNGEANYLKHSYKIAGAAGTETPSGGSLSASTLKLGAFIALRAASSGASLNLGTATGSGAAQSLSLSKAVALETASGSGAAQAMSASKAPGLGTASGTGAPQPMSFTKALSLGAATGTGAPATIGHGKSLALGSAAGSGAAQTLTPAKALGLQIATGSGAAQSADFTAAGSMALGTAAGTGAPQPMTFAKAWTLGQAAGSGAAQPLALTKAAALGSAVGAGAVQVLALAKALVLGRAQGTGEAQELVFTGPAEEYWAPEDWTVTTRPVPTAATVGASYVVATRVAAHTAVTREDG